MEFLKLVELQYKRNNIDFRRGMFRVTGDDLMFSCAFRGYSLEDKFFGDEVEDIKEFDPLSEFIKSFKEVKIANSHYITPKPRLENVVKKLRRVKNKTRRV